LSNAGLPNKVPSEQKLAKKTFYADLQLLIFKKAINFDPTVHLTFDGRYFFIEE
jgi:hypothetical protein